MGFFKAYDMRGTFGVDFTPETVYRVGRSLPSVVPGRRWLVGRDGRETSACVRRALVRGLADAGADVTDLGLCTTPMIAYFTASEGFDGGVMVTASHNPPGDNGLKVSARGARPVGYADGLDAVERSVSASRAPYADADAPLPPDDLARRAAYASWLAARLPAEGARLSFAVDCSNGMAALLARALFPDALLLNGTVDGRFPAHSPNPLRADARRQVAEAVRANGLDCGVVFDGDADRAMFVDETGAFVQPDYLIPIVARAARRAARAGASSVVLHDVRTSRGVVETLREDGFAPVMVPVGHAFAKPKMRETGALCGGELAGHYYFGEFFGCDSGFLAVLHVLSELALARARGETFSSLVRPIVSRYANSGERNFTVGDKAAAIARAERAMAASFPPETGRSALDGVRVEFEDGWVNLRASNTEPYLRLLAEFRDPRVLEERLAVLTAAIGEPEKP